MSNRQPQLGRFINLAGPSAAAGKSAIMAELLKLSKLNLVRLSTYTTRAPRPSDPYDRLHHRFVTEKKFFALKRRGFFLETKKLRHAWYGSPIRDIERLLDTGKNVISDVDPQRIKKIRRRLPGMVAIFVDAPNSFLRKRLVERGESGKEIGGRLSTAARERRFKKYYDKVFTNDEGRLEEVVAEIAKYLKNRLE